MAEQEKNYGLQPHEFDEIHGQGISGAELIARGHQNPEPIRLSPVESHLERIARAAGIPPEKIGDYDID